MNYRLAVGSDLVERAAVTSAVLVIETIVGLTFKLTIADILIALASSALMIYMPFKPQTILIMLLFSSSLIIGELYTHGVGLWLILPLISITVGVLLTISDVNRALRYFLILVVYLASVFSYLFNQSMPLLLANILMLIYVSSLGVTGPLTLVPRYRSWIPSIPVLIIALSVLTAILAKLNVSPLTPLLILPMILKSTRADRPIKAMYVFTSAISLISSPLYLIALAPSLTVLRKVRFIKGLNPPEAWLNSWIGGKYFIERVVDAGGFSYVLLGRFGKERYAIKVLRYVSPRGTPLASDPKVVESFKREMSRYLLVNSNRVVKVYEIHINEEKLPYRSLESYLDDPPYMVMEYMAYGSLRKYLNEKGRLPLSEAIRIGYETALALKELNEMGLVHLDLKPENVLFKDRERKIIKLGDLGASRIYTGSSIEVSQFSLAYAAPEVIFNRVATAKADVYSLGLILYEMLMGFNPQSYVIRGQKPPMDSSIPPQLASLIMRCLDFNPFNRPSIDEVIAVLGALLNNLDSLNIHQ